MVRTSRCCLLSMEYRWTTTAKPSSCSSTAVSQSKKSQPATSRPKASAASQSSCGTSSVTVLPSAAARAAGKPRATSARISADVTALPSGRSGAVDARGDAVGVPVRATAVGAGPERQHEPRLGQVAVGVADQWGELVGHRPGYHKHLY